MSSSPTSPFILRIRDGVLTVLFFIGILAPSVVWMLQPAGVSETSENRELNTLPVVPSDAESVRAFPSGFEAWYNDHFGLRAPLIHAHNVLKHDVLGVSPTDDVVVGREGWLYPAADHEREYARARPATSAELEHFAIFLEARRKMLADRGIRFLFVVAPNKRTIYPEYLPAHARPITDRSLLDQLLEYLHEESRVDVVDLRPSLLKAKDDGLVYLKTDSHWNPRGRLAATNTILNALTQWFDGVEPIPLEEYIQRERSVSGDLARMIGFKDIVVERAPTVVTPKARLRTVSGPESYPGYGQRNQSLRHARRYVLWTNSSKKLRAVFMRDSFGQGLAPYLAEHFERLALTPRNELDLALLDQEQPHVVIMEWVERYLHAPGGLYSEDEL